MDKDNMNKDNMDGKDKGLMEATNLFAHSLSLPFSSVSQGQLSLLAMTTLKTSSPPPAAGAVR